MKYIIEFEDEPCMYEDEVHFYKCIQAPWWGLSERVIKQLTPYQPDAPDTNVGNITNSCAHENDPISRQMALDAITDELMPSTPLSAVIRAKNRLKDLPAVQPDHIAESGRMVERTGKPSQDVSDSDLISRKAAIDALARMMPRSYTPDGSHPADEEIFRAQEIFADCIEALEILPSAQPEKRWIPCSERLPYAEYGESDNVLATCGYRDVEDGSIRWIKTLYFNGGNWCYPTGETYLEKVYAWMPLPEAYKEGGEQE